MSAPEFDANRLRVGGADAVANLAALLGEGDSLTAGEVRIGDADDAVTVRATGGAVVVERDGGDA